MQNTQRSLLFDFAAVSSSGFFGIDFRVELCRFAAILAPNAFAKSRSSQKHVTFTFFIRDNESLISTHLLVLSLGLGRRAFTTVDGSITAVEMQVAYSSLVIYV